jgi:hypothetical protein
MKNLVQKIVVVVIMAALPFSAHATEKKRNPANVIVTVQGILAGIEAKKVKIRMATGRVVYVPRQRVELKGQAVGSSKVSARMTQRELASLNPFYYP